MQWRKIFSRPAGHLGRPVIQPTRGYSTQKLLPAGFRTKLTQKSLAMQWWPEWRRGTAALGVFALMLQVVLSFGHIHADDLGVLQAVEAASGKTTHVAISRSTQSPGERQIPGGGLPDDDCPICTVMHLVASGLLPSPPSVLAPANAAGVLQTSTIQAFNLAVTRYVLRQTRAPPIA
jgi:hypothetical protein